VTTRRRHPPTKRAPSKQAGDELSGTRPASGLSSHIIVGSVRVSYEFGDSFDNGRRKRFRTRVAGRVWWQDCPRQLAGYRGVFCSGPPPSARSKSNRLNPAHACPGALRGSRNIATRHGIPSFQLRAGHHCGFVTRRT
jgi:hypothetical protein